MIVLNVIAWIILIISILAYTVETVREETIGSRVANFIVLLGLLIVTIRIYFHKQAEGHSIAASCYHKAAGIEVAVETSFGGGEP